MSKQSNPTLIGGFVVGAVLLIAAAAALFGGNEVFAKRFVYNAYFEEQTKGLRVGANVLLNGVRVGYVSDISLLVDEEHYTTITRVTMEILPDTYIVTQDGVPRPRDTESLMGHDELIYDVGLRAQLEIESFITGQLLIRLDHRPDTEAIMRGSHSDLPEIPTIPSNIQEILTKIQNWAANIRDDVDIGELAQSLNRALDGIGALAGSDELHSTIAGIDEFINSEDTQRLTATIDNTLVSIREAADEAKRVLGDTDANVDALSADIKPVLSQFTETLAEMERALVAANIQLRGDTEEIYQLQSTLKEVELAASAIREFFDYIERNPEAILRGKSE